MSKTREALDRIKAELLKDAPANEKQNIEAVFVVGTEVLDNIDRLATAHERIAAALEEANKPVIAEAPKG